MQAANVDGIADGSKDYSTSDSSASDIISKQVIYKHKKHKKKDNKEASDKAKKKHEEKNKKDDASDDANDYVPVHPDQKGWQVLKKANIYPELIRYVNPQITLPLLQAEGAIIQLEAEIINKQGTSLQQVITMMDMLRKRPGAFQAFVKVCKETKQCEHLMKLLTEISEDEQQPMPTAGESLFLLFVSRLTTLIETTYTRWSLAYVYEFSGATNIGTDDHWVDLKLSKKPTKRMQEEVADKVDCEYVTKWLARGTPVVIKGEPGMGKTTFLKKICYDWLHPKPLKGQPSPSAMAVHLQKYSLLLPVEMRSAEKSDGLLEMAVKYLVKRLKLPFSEKNRKDLLKEIGKKAEQGEVLLLLDAYDEQEIVCTELQEILSNDNYLQPCRLLITTRPEMLCKMDAAIEVVQVCGLTDDDQKRFVDAYCKNPRARARMLELLKDDANGAVKSTAVMPFFLAIMCFMAEENADMSQPILPFPDRIGRLFDNFIDMSLKRLDKKYMAYGVNDAEKNVDPIKQLARTKVFAQLGFQVIGELAYETLQNGKKSFTAEQFKDHRFTRELCLNLEFLTTAERQSLVFVHSTFQEFFASHHLHTQKMKPLFEDLRRDMYTLSYVERNILYKNIVVSSLKLYQFRKNVEDRKKEVRNKGEQSCMKYFLAYFDENTEIKAAEYWDNLNDGGQFITKLNSDTFNRLEAANYFDKFQERLLQHYQDKILTPKESAVSKFMDLTFRVKGSDPDTEIESVDFDQLAMSLIEYYPIVIYSDTHMGKSTTVARIVNQWQSFNSPWLKYTLILFIPLARIVDQFETILDMCLAYLLPQLDMKLEDGFISAELTKHLKFLASEGKMLVILEDLHRMSGKCKELEVLLQANEQLPDPPEIIITMRSHHLTSRNFGANVQLLHLQGYHEIDTVNKFLDANCATLNEHVTSATNLEYADWIYSPGLLAKASKLIGKPTDIDKSLIHTGMKVWHDSLEKDRVEFEKGARTHHVRYRWHRNIIRPLAELAYTMWTADQKHFAQQELGANMDQVVFDYYVSRGWIVGQTASAAVGGSLQKVVKLHFLNKSLQLYFVAYQLWRRSRYFYYIRTDSYKKVKKLFVFADKAIRGRKLCVALPEQQPRLSRFESDDSIG